MKASSALLVAGAITLTGCAGFLNFLDRHGRDIAGIVLDCVPLSSPVDEEEARRCFEDAAERELEELESSGASGSTVLDCASALRDVEHAERNGEDPGPARARAEALIRRLE